MGLRYRLTRRLLSGCVCIELALGDGVMVFVYCRGSCYGWICVERRFGVWSVVCYMALEVWSWGVGPKL